MGIQIRGSDDNISATDGSLTISGTTLDISNLNSLGTIGIQTSGPQSKLHIGNPVNTSSDIDTTNTSLIIKQSTNTREDGIYIERGGERKGYYMWINPGGGAGDGLTFSRNNNGTYSNTLILDREANAHFGGNAIFANGNGIDFSATSQAAGMTSELLDDYEEGTFTPSFTAGTVSGGYTRQVGEYTKVGRLVSFILTVDGNGNLQGAAQAIEIGGLPFTSRNVAETGGAQFSYPGDFDNTNDRRFWVVAQNNTTLSYRSATAANINGNLVNNVNSQFVLYGHYYTDS